MDGTGPSPFDEPLTIEMTPPTTKLSGIPSPLSGFVASEVLGRQKSQMPQVFGIMAVVLSVWGVLFSLFQILNASNELSLISDSGGENTIITIWTYTEPIIRIIVSIVFGYAGVELYNYKKRAIFIGLGAISINVVSGLIASYVNSIAYGQTINVQWGQIFGGIGVFFTFFCNTCCGLLMVLPLLISPQDLE